MEILFYRYNNICEPDLIQTFTAFGITVHTEEMEMTDKSIPPRQCAAKVTEWLMTHSFAFVFSINFFPAISYTCDHFQVPYVCWSVDSPVPELFSNALKKEWNRIFLFDQAQYQFFHPVNPGRVFYLPLATNVKRWESVILNMTEKDYAKYDADVSFVGSLYTEKCRYDRLLSAQRMSGQPYISEYAQGFVCGLIEAQLKVYGYNFISDTLTDRVIREIADADPDFYRGSDTYMDTDRYLAAHQYIGIKLAAVERERTLNRLAQHFHVNLYTNSDASPLPSVHCMGPALTLTEMPMIFHASKINLNITMRSIQSGLSQRIWDVLGCGGFLLTNYQSEIPEYFTIGEDLECYENLADLKEKITFYLAHDDIRYEIAQNGLKKTREQHTYIHRVLQIMRILFPQAV